jgi:hypothetical protein
MDFNMQELAGNLTQMRIEAGVAKWDIVWEHWWRAALILVKRTAGFAPAPAAWRF